MIDVLTSWTSWTTSHNAPRGRRQTLFVDVDYSRKATSHKGVMQQQRLRPATFRGSIRRTAVVLADDRFYRDDGPEPACA